MCLFFFLTYQPNFSEKIFTKTNKKYGLSNNKSEISDVIKI